MVPFYAGLTGLSNKTVLLSLTAVLNKPLDDTTTIAALRAEFTLANDRRRQALMLFNCLYECQNDLLVDSPEVQLVYDKEFEKNKYPLMREDLFHGIYYISLLGLGMTPTDCLAAAYFARIKSLTTKGIQRFRMGRCTDIGFTSFVKELRRNSVSQHIPARLDFEVSDVVFTETGLLAIKELLQGHSVIQSLSILCYLDSESANIVTVLQCILEGLAAESSCTRILLGTFGLNHTHVHYLILFVLARPTLSQFFLTGLLMQPADIRKAMPLLSEALKFSKLEILGLADCNIDDHALLQLGNGLCRNDYLSMLIINKNPYTADGVLKFLNLFINNRATLMDVTIDRRIYPLLNCQHSYHDILRQIRSKTNKWRFKVHPMEAESKLPSMSAGAQLVELPAEFSRRSVLK